MDTHPPHRPAGSGREATAAGAPAPSAVSLVIPTFNRARSLERLLRAVRESEAPAGGLEVIVVDDGSSDDTAETAGSFGAHHIRQQNAGPAAARERGWRAATGESIVFLDDDCVPAPDAIRGLVNALATVDGVGARVLPLPGDEVISRFVQAEGLVDHGVAGDGRIRWLVTAAVAFRRSALEGVGGFDLGFPSAAGEDVDLTLRLLAAGCSLGLEPAALVYHDHCSGLGDLSRIYFRRGRAARRLSSKHAIYRTDTMRSVGGYLVPREWARQYRRYRSGASPARSLWFLALRGGLTLPYAAGVAVGQPRQQPHSATANSAHRQRLGHVAAPRPTRGSHALSTPCDVSVVVPTFNRPASLRRLLTSIDTSVVPPGAMEVIVVGYGAEEELDVVDSFKKARYIVQPGSGPADAREAGWRAGVGSRIIFVDDDCVVSPTAITILAAALDHADGVGAGIEPLGRDNIIADFAHVEGVVDHRLVEGQIQWLVTAGVAFRRAALEAVGGFQKYQYGEDTDLTLRLLASKRELRIEPSARIYHDHRTRFGQLFTSYYRRGTCERRLMAAYPKHRAAKRRAARDLVSPRAWVATYQGYRREVSAPRSMLFVMLKALLIIPYAAGTILGERSTHGRHAAT